MAAISLFVRWRLRASARKQAELEAIVSARTENLSKANRALDEKARQLRSSEDRLRLLFQQTPAGIFLFDRDLKVTECNDQFLSLLQSRSRGGSRTAPVDVERAGDTACDSGGTGRDEREATRGRARFATGFGCSWVALSTVPCGTRITRSKAALAWPWTSPNANVPKLLYAKAKSVSAEYSKKGLSASRSWERTIAS